MSLSEKKNSLQIEAAAQSSCGRRRELNEDAVFHRTRQTEAGESAGLYLVCDGLGGHQAGEVASRLTVETVTAELTETLLSDQISTNNGHSHFSSMFQRGIQTAITKANAEIRGYAQTHREITKLATTINLVLIHGNMAYIANVGDSRTYIYRSRQLTRITQDHSIAAELVRRGRIDASEFSHHPQRNILYRTLGSQRKDDLEVDLFRYKLQPGDKLLLCSDGLWQAFPDAVEMARWLGSTKTPTEICRQLVTEANRRDGSDNISAVVISVKENRTSKWLTKLFDPMIEVFSETA